jgi:hypothetical protein
MKAISNSHFAECMRRRMSGESPRGACAGWRCRVCGESFPRWADTREHRLATSCRGLRGPATPGHIAEVTPGGLLFFRCSFFQNSISYSHIFSKGCHNFVEGLRRYVCPRNNTINCIFTICISQPRKTLCQTPVLCSKCFHHINKLCFGNTEQLA